MAWLYVPASEGLSSASVRCSANGIAQYATSSATLMPRTSLQIGCGKRHWTTLPFGVICEPSTRESGVESWISSLLASRASHTQRLAEAVASQSISGLRCSASSESAFRPQSSLRTSPSEPFAGPLRIYAAAALPLGSLASAPPSWVPRISGRAGGYLPTPTTRGNQFSDSMQKWPAYARLRALTGRSAPIAFWEWMMGLPIGWTDCAAPETESSHG